MFFRRFLINALVLFLPLFAQAQVPESHKAFMREMRYYLDSKGLAPKLTESNQILFNYSGKPYTMALKGREVNPYALLVYRSREYDDTFTREFVSTIAPSEGLNVIPLDDSFRIQAESHVFDAESFKYVFRTVMDNLVLYEKGIDEQGASLAGYIRLDNEKWDAVDKNDETAILSYINEGTVYRKRHLEEAKIMYDLLHSHNSSVEEARGKVAYAKDLYNRGEARSEAGSKRVYDLLTEASRVMELDSQSKSILSEIAEDRAYRLFKDNPDIAAAEDFLRAYPDGLHRHQVDDWLSKHTKRPRSVRKGAPFHAGIGASYFGTRKGGRPTGILEFKLGDPFQRLNWIVSVSGRPDIVKDEGTKSIFVNTALKFNVFPITQKCRFYVAPGGGWDFLKESVEAYGRAGLCFKHLDIAGLYQTVVYYPVAGKKPPFNYYTGVSLIWYF